MNMLYTYLCACMFVCICIYIYIYIYIYIGMAQGKTSDYRLREPAFESYAAVLKPWAKLCSLYIAPIHSAV